MHLKKNFSKINTIVIIAVLVIVFICKFIMYINVKGKNIVVDIGVSNVTKLVSIIVNDAVKDVLSNDNITNELFISNESKDSNIYTVDLDSSVVNEMLTDISLRIESELKYLELGQIDMIKSLDELGLYYDINFLNNGIVYKIPLGVVFNNSFLANFGPSIPIRYSLVGSILSNLNTKISNYGINNALVECSIHIIVSLNILIPFYSEPSKFEYDVPVALKIINGRVPEYYSNGLMDNGFLVKVPVE